MSTQLAISCPHCAATLKLKNNAFVGKKVPCPKCKKPFVVEQPPEDEFLAGDDNDFGAMDSDDADVDEELDSPRPKAKSKGESKGAKGKKKKSKSGGGFAPIAMIGGGIVLGLGLIGGLVYGAITMFGDSSDAAPAVAADPPPADAEAVDAAAEKPKVGDKAVDVLAYPGMVISAGEKSKSKANTLADKHNSDIEAAMQEGAPAAAPPAAEVEAAPDAAGENAAAMAKPEPEKDADGAAAKPARKLSKKEQKLLEEQQEQGMTGDAPPPAPMLDGDAAEATEGAEAKPAPALGLGLMKARDDDEASPSADKAAPAPQMKSDKGDDDAAAAAAESTDEKQPKSEQKSRSRRRSTKDKSND